VAAVVAGGMVAGRRGVQLHAEAIPLAELEELALLHYLLLQQAQWHVLLHWDRLLLGLLFLRRRWCSRSGAPTATS
jgi:hypothetical protein